MAYKWGIKQRVLLLALLPTLVISLLLSIYFISIRLNDLNKALQNRGEAIALRLSSQGEYGVLTNDNESLRTIARKSLSNEVSSVVFFTHNGIEIASAGKLHSNITPPNSYNNKIIIDFDSKDTISFLVPVTLPEIIIEDHPAILQLQEKNSIRNAIIGWVKVELEKKATRVKEYQVLIHSILIVLLGISISILLALRMGLSVTKPILAMTKAVEEIKNGKLTTRISTKSKWELDILKSGINTMVNSMQKSQEDLQHNVEQATADLRTTLEHIEIQNIELQSARKEAESNNKVKSEFLTSMSHELCTPLNAIIGFINLLAKTELNINQKDYINILQKSSASLLSIINEILDFSKIETGKLKLAVQSMNIRECVEDTLTLLAPTAHEKNLELIPFIYNDVPEKIIADPLRIKQVLTNLIINAIKFTETGNVVIRVMLEDTDKDNIKLGISVTDTGVGLTNSQQEELLSSFNQGSPKLSKTFGNTSLGLIISSRIVEQMHGSIELESEPEIGTTFRFTLQAIKDTNISVSDNNEQPLFNTRVLVIDKNSTTRLSITHLLKSWGVLVTELSCLSELQEYFKNKTFDIKPCDMLFLGIDENTISNNLFSNAILLANKYNLLIGVMLNTTEHLVHAEFLQNGASLSIAKPIIANKLFTAMCNVFSAETQAHSSSTLNPDMNISVLAVDDNLANLKLLSALLESIGGIKVICVTSGAEAIQLSLTQQFDLILMDINMPVLDGLQTTQKIRQKSHLNAKTPVIALSAHIHHDEKANLSQVGINTYLNKPISDSELKATIYKWTHKSVIENQSYHDASVTKIMPKITKLIPNSKSVDWEFGLKLAAGKKDLATEMFEMLNESLPTDLQLINAAYSIKDFYNLREHVHRLHGTCCYCGVPRLKQITRDLEIATITRNVEKIRAGIGALNLESNQVLKILVKELMAIA